MAMRASKMSKMISIAIVLAMIMAQVEVARAVDCNINALRSCLPVIKDPSLQPTDDCCTNLKAQQPCLCSYRKDPRYRIYFNSPGTQKLSSACGVPAPICT